MNKKRLFFLFRCFTFLVGMNILAMGISTITNTDLGTTPITSIPYAVNAIFPFSIGVYTGLINTCFVVAQRFILGKKRFQLIHAMQLPPVLFFGMSIDFWLHYTEFVQALSYFGRVGFLLVGIVLMAIGILIMVASNVIVLPGEGIVLAIAYRTRKSFGSIKVICDSSMVIIAMILSFVALGTIVGVREGTIASAVFTGFVVRFLSFVVGKVTGRGQGESGKKTGRRKGGRAASPKAGSKDAGGSKADGSKADGSKAGADPSDTASAGEGGKEDGKADSPAGAGESPKEDRGLEKDAS